jgi:succinoglycan biosynthesis protein ExoV
MKLFYYIRPDQIPNFGDSLNPWLWAKLILQELDNEEKITFVGIGTLLNDLLAIKVPLAEQFVIFSSGVGYGQGEIPQINHHWQIYCLRGPLSAQKLRFSPNIAITDGAILIRRIFRPTKTKKYQFTFIPHVENAIINTHFWFHVCNLAGIKYLDPRLPVETILSIIEQTEIVLAEAMHGAIAAEALRIPWIPLYTNLRILPFKWIDWCRSVNLEYNPAQITSAISDHSFLNYQKSPQDWLNMLDQLDKSPLENIKLRKAQINPVTEQMITITQTFEPNLAKESLIESLTIQLEEKLAQFKQDVKLGKFS